MVDLIKHIEYHLVNTTITTNEYVYLAEGLRGLSEYLTDTLFYDDNADSIILLQYIDGGW